MGKYLNVTKDSNIICNNPYNGIYEVKNDSLTSNFSLKKNDFLYFTTYEDLGMGYRSHLFVYDLKHKIYICDPDKGKNNLYSIAGVFYVYGDYIIKINKPFYDIDRDKWSNEVTVYKVNNGKFNRVNYFEELGENLLLDDQEKINFYKKIKGKLILSSG